MANISNPPSTRMARAYATPHVVQQVHEPRESGRSPGNTSGNEAIPFGDYLPAGSSPGEYNPGHGGGFFGLGNRPPTLTAQGQAEHAQIAQFSQSIAALTASNPGAPRELILQEALKAGGPGMATLIMTKYPQLLTSADTLHQALSPQSSNQINTKTGQVYQTDEQGNVSAKDIPGAIPDPQKAGAPQLKKVGNNYVQPDPNNPGRWIPALDQNGQPMTAPPKVLGPVDSRYFSVVPQILKDINILKEAGSGTQGFPWGPESKLAAHLIGTNDPAIIWNNALSNLKATLASGALPAQQKSALQTVLDSLPSVWNAQRFNTTGLNMFASGVREEAKIRIDQAQANGQAVAPSTIQAFQNQGIFPQSAGWADPRAMIAAGPQGIKNMSDQQLQWIYNHRNDPSMVTPEQNQAALAEATQRAQQKRGAANATQNAPPAQNGTATSQPTDFSGGQNPNNAVTGAGAAVAPPTQTPQQNAAPQPQDQGSSEAPIPASPAQMGAATSTQGLPPVDLPNGPKQ